MAIQRSSGILLPLFSLPSPCGIGTMGQAARDFVDFLAAAKQRWWQLLPVGPTGYGDSPYQSFSAYAGNPYFIDLEALIEEGLLTRQECEAVDWGSDAAQVDYGKVYAGRFSVLQRACERGYARDAAAVARFAEENRAWLPDYALFMACKRRFGMKPWTQWEDRDIRLHRPEAAERYRALLESDVRLFTWLQFLFFRQWDALRAYAREKGVGLIGDMPLYVALDSADVWSDPGSFLLDEENVPVEVAGVPPDYFSADGQLWGNPLYRWDVMKQDGYGWWIRRIGGAARLYDVLRIDHFRGLESYWAVPYGAPTARSGRWVRGPGMDLVATVTGWFPDMEFIAEDLGQQTPALRDFLRDSGLPGMKVLSFAFDAAEPSDHLPHNYGENCVCYAGTHDNATLRAWYEAAGEDERALARAYLGLNDAEGVNFGVLRGGMGSVARLFVAQMQDYLDLGAEGRINVPGTAAGNWRWRMPAGAASDALAERIARMTRLYGRAAQEGRA